jgi:hypothetical protein
MKLSVYELLPATYINISDGHSSHCFFQTHTTENRTRVSTVQVGIVISHEASAEMYVSVTENDVQSLKTTVNVRLSPYRKYDNVHVVCIPSQYMFITLIDFTYTI